MFKAWCAGTKDKSKKKTFRTYSEKDGGRAAVLTQLGEAVRTHYDQADRIADDVARLGYDGAAEILRALLPQSKRARSGDLGEILASELVEEDMGFRVSVRRMRFKDGREVAMRGDDFIGVGYDPDEKLWLLKGESKSRANFGNVTIVEAREALNRYGGRCTPDSLLFIANRLLESADKDAIEYPSSSREAWKSQAEENLRLGIVEPAGADDEEEEKIEEEPMSHLVEKLDATVLGLVEALDANSEDLPRLLDEALQGSLWARQIGREDEDEQQGHKAILQARASVIWRHTTPEARKGHYAMGSGLRPVWPLTAWPMCWAICLTRLTRGTAGRR